MLFDDDTTELGELCKEVANCGPVPVPVSCELCLRDKELSVADGRNPFGVDVLWTIVRACLVQHVEVGLKAGEPVT